MRKSLGELGSQGSLKLG